MCDKVVAAFVPLLKFVHDWFFTKKMIGKLDDPVFLNDDILFSNEGSGNATFFSDAMGILSADLNNIKLNDSNFDEEDPESIIHVRLMAQCKS